MALDLSQIEALRAKEIDPIWAGRLPEPVAHYLGARLPEIYLSYDSLVHIQKKHPHLVDLDLLMLPFAFERGLWVAERNRAKCACVTWCNPEDGRRYLGAVKTAANGFETYATTFHRARTRQTRSLLRRGPVLQTHW